MTTKRPKIPASRPEIWRMGIADVINLLPECDKYIDQLQAENKKLRNALIKIKDLGCGRELEEDFRAIAGKVLNG